MALSPLEVSFVAAELAGYKVDLKQFQLQVQTKAGMALKYSELV